MPGTRPNPVLRRLLRLPAWLYRWHCGWVLGHRFLLLTHIGRRSMRRHATVLEVMAYHASGPEMIVMSGWGHGAGWLRNIEATHSAEIAIGTRRFVATHRLLDADDAIRVVADYERRNRFAAPVIRAVLSGLLGWRYDGTEEARRRLVTQLPLVAFRPEA
jgi:deazaflavin-dependent oxidoreductase (nitroreductase family)